MTMRRKASVDIAIWVCLGLVVALCVTSARGDVTWPVGNNITAPTSLFYSRPDIIPPAIDITVFDEAAITPGYIFIAPWRRIDSGPDVGPYIYDNSGNLVWSGAGTMGTLAAHGPHVCNYKDADHLCFFQGASHIGFARGVALILDDTYQIVKAVQAGGSTMGTGDMHEFRLVDGGRNALISVYQVEPYDLAPAGLHDGIGWIVDSTFQEIRVDTGEVLFEWRSLDHEETSPRNGRVHPGQMPTGGDGLLHASAWDYFHINSVDKNADGDYLISARHMSALYKISGKDGRVLWQLDGQEPGAYEKSFNFSNQHDARWLHDNATHSVISLFDNAYDDYISTATYSRGMVVELNHIALTATLTSELAAPPVRPNNRTEPVLSGSQGNMQLLGSGNAFIGWGVWPFFSEHSAAGETLLWGEISHNGSRVMNYRALKFNWTATPHDRPTVFAYSRDATPASGTAFYASWNGATEVSAWNFYASAAAADGPWHRIGGADRTGFETTFRWANYSEWTFAEALDKDGNAIRASGVCRTFVPSEKLRASCDEWACATPSYAGNQSLAGQTGASKPEDVDWENFSYREGFDRVSHYPSRRSSDLAWEIGPQILFITVVLLVSVVLLYLSPRVYRRLVGRHDRGTDNKGEYVTVGAAAQNPHFRVEGAGEQAGSELHNI